MFLLHGAFHNSVQYQAPHNFIDFNQQYMLTHCISSGTKQQSNKKKKNQRLVPSRHSRSAKFCVKSDTQSSLKLPQFLTTVQNLLSMHSKLANNAKTEATLKGEKKYPCQQISTFTTFDDDPFLLDLASYQPYDFFVLFR